MITQEEIDANFTAFKEAKKRRNRNTDTDGAMHMMDSDVTVQYDELPDYINVVMDESPNDGNYTH